MKPFGRKTNLGKTASGEQGKRSPGRSRKGFTILEIMIAIFIFSMVLTAIYSIWVGILRGRKAVQTTLAEVQRSRITMHAIEDAFLTVLMFQENVRHYLFIADTSGDDAYVSMVSRLPASYPGVGRFAGGDLVVRRVSFYTEPGPAGDKQLVMTQAPMLLATNNTDAQPYTLVLAHDVSEFKLKFWDMEKNEWSDEWSWTNKLPRMVHITLGLGKAAGSSTAHDIVSRVVAIPAQASAGSQPFLPPGSRIPGMMNPPATGTQPGYQQRYPSGYQQPGYNTRPGGAFTR